MEGFEKRLLNDYYALWRNVDALEISLEKGDEFKEKVGETQFKLITEQLPLMKGLKDVIEQRVNDLNLMEKARIEGYNAWENDFSDDKILDRAKVLRKAYEDCMREMYAKSQPVGDYDEYVRQYQTGELTDDDERVYNRHYLSREEYDYILDKYVDAYGMKEKWSDYVDTVKEYFGDDAPNDKYIEAYVDENGNHHSGYTGYEKLPNFKNVVSDILSNNSDNSNEDISQKIYDAVMNRIETCKRFYRFDREESGFHVNIGFGASPTFNKEVVKKYWKEHGVDVEIEDRDPNRFWEKDAYGDDYECDDEYYDDCEEIQ
jgi:hypothetical protein